MSFFLRQLYRVLIVWPWVYLVSPIIVALVGRPSGREVGECVVITSVCIPVEKSLTYSGTRSAFAPDERIAQTLATVESVRARLPDAVIVLVEAGQQTSALEPLKQAVDQYIDVGARTLVRRVVDGPFKSLGEAIMLIAAHAQLPRAAYYWKLTGRYLVTDQFRREDWRVAGFSWKLLKDAYVSTRLYGVHGDSRAAWLAALVRGLALGRLDYPIEHTLYRYTDKASHHYLTSTGLAGTDGVNGQGVID